MRMVAVVLFISVAAPAAAETVNVKYRGPIDLKAFACTSTTRSTFVRRVCYDKANSHMLIKLNGQWLQHCGIPESIVNALLNAPVLGPNYNAHVKKRFSCRVPAKVKPGAVSSRPRPQK